MRNDTLIINFVSHKKEAKNSKLNWRCESWENGWKCCGRDSHNVCYYNGKYEQSADRYVCVTCYLVNLGQLLSVFVISILISSPEFNETVILYGYLCRYLVFMYNCTCLYCSNHMNDVHIVCGNRYSIVV